MSINIADVVIVKDNKVLLVQEKKEIARGLWNFPGGKVEQGESIQEAAVREIKEELGVSLIDPVFFKMYPYNIGDMEFDLNIFTGKIDDKIQLKQDEIQDFGWFSLDDVIDMSDKLRGSIIIQQIRDVIEKNQKTIS